jgi:phage protein D
MMDREEKSAEHPAQDETVIALKIIASYAQFGLIPQVIPPPVIDLPLPIDRIPVQQATDLQYLREMAGRYGYVFFVTPGPAPFTNTAYWGPPVRIGLPQRALSVNLGGETNVERIDFRSNALGPTVVTGQVQDRLTNQTLPVQTFASLRPPLSTQPALLVNQANVRRTQLRQSGLSATEAFARAQGMTDAASDAVEANGELDALRYGDLLQPRGLVGLRGAGYSHDGFWYVKRVTHDLRREAYKQQFTLTREGLGSTTPVVIP